MWKTKKVKTLFTLKDQNPHPLCKIYKVTCVCEEKYIGETNRNVATRWGEHENPKHNSEPAKHLQANPTHSFVWKSHISASTFDNKRKILEGFFIATEGPSLDNQLMTKKLILFKHGVT